MRKTTLVRSLFTLLLFVCASWVVKGQERQVIYYEDFGTKGTNGKLYDYDGCRTPELKPYSANWFVSISNPATPSTDVVLSEPRLKPVSGACYAHIGAVASEIEFDFKELLLFYHDVRVEFIYYKGPAANKSNTMQLLFSSDGGKTWSEDNLPENVRKRAWYGEGVDLESQYLASFKMKFVTAGTDLYRLDDILITGIPNVSTSCELPVLSSGLPILGNIAEVANNSYLVIQCATPNSMISYKIDNGEERTVPSPAKIFIEADCSLSAFASVNNGAIKSESINYSIKALDYSERIFVYSEGGPYYAMSPNILIANWISSEEVVVKDGKIVVPNLNLYWRIYASKTKEGVYYIGSSTGKYLYADVTSTGATTLGYEGVASEWLWSNNAFYTKATTGEILSLKGATQANAQKFGFRSIKAVAATYGKFFSYYNLDNSLFALKGDHMIQDINQILKRDDLKWIDISDVNLVNDGNRFNVPKNPNCLFFAGNNYIGLDNNEISDSGCDFLELTDNIPFETPYEFAAANATYSRLAWQDNGWETIILPFDVTTLPDQYVFDEYLESTSDVVSFRRVTSLKANTPYLMKFTGPKVDGQARCVFSASNVTVSPIMNNSDFTGVYEKTSTNGKYILTVSGGQTVFKLGGSKSAVNPFRAYLDINRPAGAAPLRVVNLPADATGVEDVIEEQFAVWNGESGEIVVNNPIAQFVNVMSIDGRIVKSLKLEAGRYVIDGLPAGLCIINGKKIMVK